LHQNKAAACTPTFVNDELCLQNLLLLGSVFKCTSWNGRHGVIKLTCPENR